MNLQVNDNRNNAILSTLKSLNGVILIDLLENKIYFGRDSIGKRSLCYSGGVKINNLLLVLYQVKDLLIVKI